MAGFLSRLFGGGAPRTPEPEPSQDYKGYAITPNPASVSDGFRIGATIEKDGRRHELIRADILRDRDGAVEASVAKARQMIDQLGERLFDDV
jgi:hypothetical protein